MPEYWRNKILSNVARDERQFEELLAMGIRPMRFYASELKKEPENCLAKIVKTLEERE